MNKIRRDDLGAQTTPSHDDVSESEQRKMAGFIRANLEAHGLDGFLRNIQDADARATSVPPEEEISLLDLANCPKGPAADLVQERNAYVFLQTDTLQNCLKIALNPQTANGSIEHRRQRLVLALNAFFNFMRDLNLREVAAVEIDELRAALLDANEGRKNPLLVPSKPTSKRESNHPDYSQLWRARANFVLAVKARQAIDGDNKTFTEAAKLILKALKPDFVERIASKKSLSLLNSEIRKKRGEDVIVNLKDRTERLLDIPDHWLGEIQRKKHVVNIEAAELYGAMLASIKAHRNNPNQLRRIELRCLRAARRQAALQTV